MSYAQLETHFRRLGHLAHIADIMHWDEAVMMPPAAGPARAEAMATLHVMIHELQTDPRLVDWLAAGEREVTSGNLNSFQTANFVEMRRIVRRASGVPTDLVARRSEAQMRCEQAWRKLRAENDWENFAPLLAEVVNLKRQEAQALAQALDLSPYDALMDEYEPGVRSAEIDRVFADLRTFLPPFIEKALERQAHFNPITPTGPFSIAAQEKLGRDLMKAVGFDMAHGRLDVSHHPFCGGIPSDVRITTRYDEQDFTTSLLGVLHETGHAKYEQGLPEAWRGQPVGHARGMSTHEGQSLLQEMQISRSRAFLTFAAPKMAAAFPEAAAQQPQAFTVENLYRLYTRVARSKIRVDADEVTYPCHILLRYDIERALIDGTMNVKEIPEAWDSAMQSLLAVHTAGDYRNGCMQDAHWPAGAFGYFPTYTLGAMTAAQVFAAIKKSLPNWESQVAHGSFDAINDFLRTHIWSYGSRCSADELMRHATGESLNARYFEEHLQARYLDDKG